MVVAFTIEEKNYLLVSIFFDVVLPLSDLYLWYYVPNRDVEAVIFQPLPIPPLPLSLSKTKKTTVDISSTKFVISYNQKV